MNACRTFALGAVLAAVALSGCQTDNARSPLSYHIPVGSRLTLQRELTIPADDASIYIQNGRVLPFSEIQKYEPHCRFAMRTRENTPRTVQKDEFLITQVRRDVSDGLTEIGPIRLARAGVSIGDTINDSEIMTFATRLRLNSATQPDVNSLNCGQWADTYARYQYITIDELRHTLAGLFSLQLAQ
ncbi:MAG: hypothetical protein HY308_14655 [Gammaproteobacteria bacterium]|nr:hypothetical protein [Gammaproteobacteria bacterium]